MTDWYEGQKVWILGANRREPSEGVVTKVGRTLVYVQERPWNRHEAYRKDDGIRNDAYGHDFIRTEEQQRDIEEARELLRELHRHGLDTRSGTALGFELPKLRRVVAALREDGDE